MHVNVLIQVPHYYAPLNEINRAMISTEDHPCRLTQVNGTTSFWVCFRFSLCSSEFIFSSFSCSNEQPSDVVDSVWHESAWDICCCPVLQLIPTPNSRDGDNFWDQSLNVWFSRVPTDNPVTANMGQIVPIIQLESTQFCRCFAFVSNMYSGIKSRFWLEGEYLYCEISLPL